MRILRPTAPAVAGIVLLSLAACASPTATPTPTGTTPSESPAPAPSPTSSAAPEEVEVTAAVVVTTASTLSVFGTDGTTLASVDYEMAGAAAVAEIAEALDEEPVVTPVAGDVDSPCPPATAYAFGGLTLRSPGSLPSSVLGTSFEVIVTGTTTSGGVGIETVAGQQIGATRSAFLAAVGESMVLYEDSNRLGFDVLNPEAHEWSRDGAYAEISGGKVSYLAAPIRLGFVGGCS